MAGFTAEQILKRIADANGVDPADMRQQIEEALQNIAADSSQPHSYMLRDMFPNGRPTVDEFVVALELELYNNLMPKASWWDKLRIRHRKRKLYGKRR